MSTPIQRETRAAELPQHEFDARENHIIGELSRAMRWVGAPLLLIGILYALAAVMGIIQAFTRPEALVSVVFVVLAMVFFLALGIWTRRAADSFHRITTTSGQDMTHLMEALENLRAKYSLLSVIVKVYVAFGVLSLVLMLVAAIAGAFKG
jgi:disulfide bond formation protein DsbB